MALTLHTCWQCPHFYPQSGAHHNFLCKSYRCLKLTVTRTKLPVVRNSHPKPLHPFPILSLIFQFHASKNLGFCPLVPFLFHPSDFTHQHICQICLQTYSKPKVFLWGSPPSTSSKPLPSLSILLQPGPQPSPLLPTVYFNTIARVTLWEQNHIMPFFCLKLQRHLFLL